MVNKVHAAGAACVGTLFLIAAGVAPGADGQKSSILPVSWQEPAPQIENVPVSPTLFPGVDAPQQSPSVIDKSAAGPVVPPSTADAATDREGSMQVSDADRRCLATAIYHEARGEPRAGQMAVAQVILNRARSGRFPTTICGVVYQPAQFSGMARVNPRENADWRAAQEVADDVLSGERADKADKAMYFHAVSVQPDWRRVKLATIGNHVFYR